jgi:hypothetical protein
VVVNKGENNKGEATKIETNLDATIDRRMETPVENPIQLGTVKI